ncbi:hypothetical protein HDU67_009102, partial [Dinochytrium kinnereticum]
MGDVEAGISSANEESRLVAVTEVKAEGEDQESATGEENKLEGKEGKDSGIGSSLGLESPDASTNSPLPEPSSQPPTATINPEEPAITVTIPAQSPSNDAGGYPPSAIPEPEEPLPPGAPTTCAICFSDFEQGDRIRELACHHIFHSSCVDPWLIAPEEDTTAAAHRTCPLCVREAILPEFRDPLVEQAMREAAEEEAILAPIMEQSRREAEEARRRREARSR